MVKVQNTLLKFEGLWILYPNVLEFWFCPLMLYRVWIVSPSINFLVMWIVSELLVLHQFFGDVKELMLWRHVHCPQRLFQCDEASLVDGMWTLLMREERQWKQGLFICLFFPTITTWIIWNLIGEANGGTRVNFSHASRTMLINLKT